MKDPWGQEIGGSDDMSGLVAAVDAAWATLVAREQDHNDGQISPAEYIAGCLPLRDFPQAVQRGLRLRMAQMRAQEAAEAADYSARVSARDAARMDRKAEAEAIRTSLVGEEQDRPSWETIADKLCAGQTPAQVHASEQLATTTRATERIADENSTRSETFGWAAGGDDE